MGDFHTRFVSRDDRESWRALFDGYAAFYGFTMDDATAGEVWRWLLDPEHVLEGLVVPAADALFAALRDLAAERGWPAIRWVTQHFNARGRAFYDRYTGGPSDFILYQWKPDSA